MPTPEFEVSDDYMLSISAVKDEITADKILYGVDGAEPTTEYSDRLYLLDLFPNGGNHTIEAVAYVGEESNSKRYPVSLPTVYSSIADVLKLASGSFILNAPTSTYKYYSAADRTLLTDGSRNIYLTNASEGMNFSVVEGTISTNSTTKLVSAAYTKTLPGTQTVEYKVTRYDYFDDFNFEPTGNLYDVVYIPGAAISGTAPNYTLTLNGSTITLYTNNKYDANDCVDVVGVVERYKETKEIIPISLTEASRVAPVTFSATNGAYLYGDETVTLSCATEGATIFYTTDKVFYKEYTGPITLDRDGEQTIMAYAKKEGSHDAFKTSVEFYYYAKHTCADVTFAPETGATLYGHATIALATVTEGATIRYQIDDEEEQVYTEPVSLLGREADVYVISAYATLEGYYNSTPTEATYYYMPKRELPMTVSAAATTVTDDVDKYTITKGQNVTVTAEGAATITVEYTYAGKDFVKEFEGTTATWQPRSGDYTVLVSATPANEDDEFPEAIFDLKVEKPEASNEAVQKPLYWNFNGYTDDESANANVPLSAKEGHSTGSWTVTGTYISPTTYEISTNTFKENRNGDTDNPCIVFGSGKTTLNNATFTLSGSDIPEDAIIKQVILTMGCSSTSSELTVAVSVNGQLSTETASWSKVNTVSKYDDPQTINVGLVGNEIKIVATKVVKGFFIADVTIVYAIPVELADAEVKGFDHSTLNVGDSYVDFDYSIFVQNHNDLRDEYSVEVILAEKENPEAEPVTEWFYEHEATEIPAAAEKPGMRKAAAEYSHEVTGSAAITGLKEKTSYLGTVNVYLNADHSGDGTAVLTPTEFTLKSEIATGIFEIDANGNASAIQWYDLAGRRIAAPTHGIFLKKQGNTVTKHAL